MPDVMEAGGGGVRGPLLAAEPQERPAAAAHGRHR